MCHSWRLAYESSRASLHAISKAGRAFSFDRGANVFHIYGSSFGPCTSASLYRYVACRSHRSAGSFFFAGSTCDAGWLWIIYVGADAAGLEWFLRTIVFCRFCLPMVMWLASSSGGSDVTPGRVEYRDARSHVNNGFSGASHFSVCTLAPSRVYAAVGDK